MSQLSNSDYLEESTLRLQDTRSYLEAHVKGNFTAKDKRRVITLVDELDSLLCYVNSLVEETTDLFLWAGTSRFTGRPLIESGFVE